MSELKSRLLLLALLVAAVAMLADLSTAPRSKFTAANYERLEIDMTLDDAIAILGEPGSIDTSMRDMQWAMWYSPFDKDSVITCIFVYPSGMLKSKEKYGRLPDRPLLMPDVLPERETPPFLVTLKKYRQEEERRSTLMLDPPAPASNAPVLP